MGITDLGAKLGLGYLLAFFGCGLATVFFLVVAVFIKLLSGEGTVLSYALFMLNGSIAIFGFLLMLPIGAGMIVWMVVLTFLGPPGLELIEVGWNFIFGVITGLIRLIPGMNVLLPAYVNKDFVWVQPNILDLVTAYHTVVSSIQTFMLSLGQLQ